MKTKISINAILLIIMFLLTSCATTPHSTKVYSKPNINIKGATLGILPFHCEIPTIGDTVSDTIGANLLDAGIRIIERTYLSRILEEQGLSLTGATGSIDYRKIGKLSNVDYLLVGTVTAEKKESTFMLGSYARRGKYTDIPNATARIVNVATGQIILSVTWARGRKVIQGVKIGEYLSEAIKKELRGEK